MQQPTERATEAVCVLYSDCDAHGGSQALRKPSGVALFRSFNGGVRVVVTAWGLTPGAHGIHVHEAGDEREGCDSMGEHFNPDGGTHGGPLDAGAHAGDLGNLLVQQDGTVRNFVIDAPRLQLTGPRGAIGRGLVVHADPDDLGRGNWPDSSTTGHSGARVMCGIIAFSRSRK